jgi:hypothetical protein
VALLLLVEPLVEAVPELFGPEAAEPDLAAASEAAAATVVLKVTVEPETTAVVRLMLTEASAVAEATADAPEAEAVPEVVPEVVGEVVSDVAADEADAAAADETESEPPLLTDERVLAR